MNNQRRNSAHELYQPYFLAGVLASHLNYGGEGFRQRDVKFLIEVASNWMDSTTGEYTIPIQNVQISRYLDGLMKEGFLSSTGRGKVVRYHLTRRGIVKLLSDLASRSYFVPLDQFFFAYYFLKSYGALLENLIETGETSLAPSLSAELKVIRDPSILVRNQLHYLEKEISKLEGRILEANSAGKIGEDTLSRGGTVEEAISEIHRKFPYELNMKRPLPELMQEFPEHLRKWEMTSGLRYRAKFLWEPLRDYLESNRKILKGLLT